METRIYFQTKTSNLITNSVSGVEEFTTWTSTNLRTRGHNLFVVITGKDAGTTVFLTPSITDIDSWFEFIHIGGDVVIQEFEYGNYMDAYAFLYTLQEKLKFPKMEKGEYYQGSSMPIKTHTYGARSNKKDR